MGARPFPLLSHFAALGPARRRCHSLREERLRYHVPRRTRGSAGGHPFAAARDRGLAAAEKERRVDFYQGRILRVDLSKSTTSVEPLRMDWAELYVGGKGLLFRHLLDEVTPGL